MAMNMDAVLRIKANVTGLPQLGKLQDRLKDVEGQSKRTAISAQGLGSAFRGLQGAVLSIGASAAVAGMVRTATSVEQLDLRLKSLSAEYGETDRLQQFVAQSAKTFGQSQIEAASGVADVYARLRPLGISLEQIQTVYRGFNAVALASGTTATDAANAFLQLSQALGSGRLQGDEFRSIAEAVPGILRLVATEMGVTVGELKDLGSEGKITSDVLINALAKGFDENSGKIQNLLALSPAQKFKEFQNSVQDLSSAIGSELLPAVIPLVEIGTDLLQLFGQLPGPVKTLTAGVVGVTAAFVALAPAISAVLSLAGTGAWTALLAAGPWVALAAGITAAVYALASYRSEAQKLAGAAAAGGAPAVAAARNMAAQKGQEISLLERQRQSAANRERASIDRRLAVLRRERDELLASARSGDRSAGGAVPLAGGGQTAAGGTTGGGRAGGGKAAADAAKKQADELARSREQGAQLGRSMSRQAILLDAASEIERQRLQVAFDFEDRQRQISQLKDAEQRKNLEIISQEQQRLQLREIDRQVQQAALDDMQRQLDGVELIAEKQQEVSAITEGIANTLGDAMASAFDGLITGAENWGNSLREIAAGALQDIARQLIRIYVIEQAISAIKNLMSPATSAISPLSGLGALATPIPGLAVGGARANGGPVQMGTRYLVGERGPELFVPGRSGTVIPNTGGTNVTVNVDASGTSAQGDSQQANQLGRVIGAAVQAELIKQKRPGGLLAT